MEPDLAKGMLKGHSDNLLSSFYINYHMLLNSQRLEDIDVEYILARSLLQFQQDAEVPVLKAQLAEKQGQFKEMTFDNEQELENLYELQKLWKSQTANLRKVLFTPQRILPFLNIGRVIRLIDGDVDWGYGVSINFHKRDSYKKGNMKN
jgi:ATP-dependent RNA helicase DOB1